jgi:RND family efflux transporter MFP subunit
MNPHILRGCLFLGTLLLVGACGKITPPPEPPRPVLTSILGASDESAAVSYSGEVRSRFETPLGFRIPGKIAARLVDAGAQVKAGDVLAKLDPADTALSAAAVDAQLELAAADVRRYRELRDRNFVSQAALDAKETGFKAARAQGDLARNQSSYTVLRAEQAGVVELVAAEVGQVVAAGQAVMRVARTDMLEVAVAIPETRMPDLGLLKTAEVSLWADEKARYQGVLRELSPVADALTRTYAARVSIVNPDARVLLGMTANVKFLRDTDGASSGSQLSVPLTAIFQQEGKPALWIVGAEQTASLRPVTIAAYGESTAILESGAQAGERIVIAGVHKLSAGEKIKAVDQVSASAPASATGKASANSPSR